MGCSKFLIREIRFGFIDNPDGPFVLSEEQELREIPQTEEEKKFASVEFKQGCRYGIFQEVSKDHAARAKRNGTIVSSRFVVWKK